MSTRPIILWTPALACGIADIDEDHKKLVGLVNRLGSEVVASGAQEVLQEILKELVQYVVFHFNREEEYMLAYDYPGYEEHKQQHDQLLNQAQTFVDVLESTPTLELWNSLGETLREWLVVHIEGQDHRLGQYLVQKGLS